MRSFVRPKINLGYGHDHADGVNSLTELIQFNATHNPDHLFALQATTKPDGKPVRVTYSQLHNAVETCSAWLVREGASVARVRREDVVAPIAVLLGSDVGLYIYVAAMLRVGTPALCLSTSLTPLAIAHLINTVKPSTILISSRTAPAAKKALELLKTQYSAETVPNVLVALDYEEFIPGLRQGRILKSLTIPPVYKAFRREDVDAYIMHSSGTTGLPKPIYHSQVYPLIYAESHRFPERDEPFGFHLSTPPIYHALGLLAPSMALSIGMPCYLLPSTVIPTARTVMAALKSTKAKFMLSVPSILEDMLTLSRSEALETLRQLEVLAIGGAPVKQSTSDDLVKNGVKFLVQGGTTEVGPIAPIEPVPPNYDHRYLILRNDIGLELVKVEGGGPLARQLVGYPPGWKKPFIMQDLIELNPKDHNQIRILGRIDDLIVLATGKKIRPASLEKAVCDHPMVKAALAFGEGQTSLGLIIELRDAKGHDWNDRTTLQSLSKSLDPYIEQGNSLIDDQGKVFKEMIVFTSESIKPLIRTDKGSLARRASCEAFSEEIKQCYNVLSTSTQAPPLPAPSDGNSLLQAIRSLVYDVTEQDNFRSASGEYDSVDFFETGMNSLQAKRLHAYISGGLRATPNVSSDTAKLDQDFVFQYPSVEKLHHALTGLMTGSMPMAQGVRGSNDELRTKAMEAMVDKYCGHIKSFGGVAKEASNRRTGAPVSFRGITVLLTGSTGSLGCMILASLAKNQRVAKIICLNRLRKRESSNIQQRQRDAMKKRGAVISNEDWKKISLRESDLHAPNFGLSTAAFGELREVTHIIHNAWPVDFNMKLASFESQIKLLTNLILLGIENGAHRPVNTPPTRLILLSSIAVVGRYSILHQDDSFGIPEQFFGPEYSTEMGYAESKWVAERIMLAAGEMYGRGEAPLLQTSSIRMGQLTGAEGSGAWNESEHFPLIVRTSTFMKKLPSLSGSSSWLPVNRAADIIAELLFSQGFKPLYQLENPSRQSWSGILRNLSIILGGSLSSPIPIIPYDDWLEEVRKLGDDPRNKVQPIFDYLEKHFMRISSGETILRTANATQDSSSMVKSTSLDLEHLEEYVNYWTSIDSTPTRRARPRL